MPLIYGTSNFLEDKLINHVLRSSTFSPCPIYLALYTAPTTASGLEEYTNIKEVSASTGYQRISASQVLIGKEWNQGIGINSWENVYSTNDSDYWEIANGTAINKTQINFPTATSDWGNITHIAVVTGSTGTSGSLYFWGTMSGCPSVVNGDTLSLGSGNLSIYLGGHYTYYLADRILNYILRKQEFLSPGINVYAALYNQLPNDASPTVEGRNGREVSGSVGYVRQMVAGRHIGIAGEGTGLGWTPPSSGSGVNSGSLVFTRGAWTDWGIIDGIGLVYANTEVSGLPNRFGVLYTYRLISSPSINEGDGFMIPALGLKVTLD